MGQEIIYLSDKEGVVNGNILLTTQDAVFKYKGKSVIMSFHPYLGPFFELVNGKELVDFTPGGERKYDNLWKQFSGWYKAKGKQIYG